VLLYLAFTNQESVGVLVVTGVIVVATGFLISQYDFLLTLKEYERAVVFRFGRVHHVGGPGWTLLIPIAESFRIVDLRTHTLDIPPQEIITADKVVVTIDAVIYLYVKPDAQSVTNSVTEVKDYEQAASEFVEATIRDVAGGLTLSELITNIGELNKRVQTELEKIAESWGVTVESVQISSIKIPKELEEALTKEKAAEQQKLARGQLADAHRLEIEAVREAAANLSDKALAYYYIRALEKLSEGQSSKIFFPIELSNLAKEVSNSVSRGKDDPTMLESLFEKYAPAIKKIAESKK
jgi:regulator of protease activity HflC (stomatin/prohibitin superfamily)